MNDNTQIDEGHTFEHNKRFINLGARYLCYGYRTCNLPDLNLQFQREKTGEHVQSHMNYTGEAIFLKKPESENFSLSGSLVSNFSLPGEEESDTEHVSDLILDEDFILQPKNRKMFLILLTGHFSIRRNH